MADPEITIPDALPIENVTEVRITIEPDQILNPEADATPRTLDNTGLSLPGFEDAATWTISTNNPAQEVAKTIVGKFGGLTALEYDQTYDPVLMLYLVAHARSTFTMKIVIDSAAFPFLIGITIPGLRCINPTSTSKSDIASAAPSTIKFAATGGGLVKDILQLELSARETTT